MKPGFNSLGLFSIPNYLHADWASRYDKTEAWGYDDTWPFRKYLNTRSGRKNAKPDLPTLLGVGGPIKWMTSGILNGYFMQKYPEDYLAGEVLCDILKIWRDENKKKLNRALEKMKRPNPPWKPSDPTHKSSGKGSLYGTIPNLDKTETVLYPKAISRTLKDFPVELAKYKPFIVGGGKKSLGYGYINIFGNKAFYPLLEIKDTSSETKTRNFIGFGYFPQYRPEQYEKGKIIRRQEFVDHGNRVKKMHARPFFKAIKKISFFDKNIYGLVQKHTEVVQQQRRKPLKLDTAVKPFLPPSKPAKFSSRVQDAMVFGGFPEYRSSMRDVRKPKLAQLKPFLMQRSKSLRQESIINKNIATKVVLHRPYEPVYSTK